MAAKPLTAGEAYQTLRDIALVVRTIRRIGQQSWVEIYCGLMTIESDGWVLTLYNDFDTLDYCDSCAQTAAPTFSIRCGRTAPIL